ncbi:serine/arginine repetitive matrix protein 1-like isoform X2 [Harpegnathos saltator]|nr:serine/arginine repetitive matrix protein 1-like isoform X2 [Harpegnathos saltator]XP_025157233.1 serine/arginine repetitive matrix protein 1-like isoform X2 [Harpegnathos saltator]
MSFKELRRECEELRGELRRQRQKERELEEAKCEKMRKEISQLRRSITECRNNIKRLEASSSSEEAESTLNIESQRQQTPTQSQSDRETTRRTHIEATSNSTGPDRAILPEARWEYPDPEYPKPKSVTKSSIPKPTRTTRTSKPSPKDSSDKENGEPVAEKPASKLRMKPLVRLKRLEKMPQDRNNNQADDKEKRKSHHRDKAAILREKLETLRKRKIRDERAARLRKEKEEYKRELKRLANQRYRKKVVEKLKAATRRLSRTIADSPESSAPESPDRWPGNTEAGGSVQRPTVAGEREPTADRRAKDSREPESRVAETHRRPRIVEDRPAPTRPREESRGPTGPCEKRLNSPMVIDLTEELKEEYPPTTGTSVKEEPREVGF